LLSERDLLRAGGSPRNADIALRIEALRGETFGAEEGANIDRAVRQRVRRTTEQFLRLLARGIRTAHDARGAAPPGEGVLLAFAYPDRIARRREGAGGRYTLANGRGAHFASPDRLSREEFIVAVELDDRDRDARILLAAALSRADLERYFADRMRRVEEVAWDAREEAVAARRCLMLDSLTIEEKTLPQADPDATAAAMLAGVRRLGLDALPWDAASRALQARMEFVRRLDRADLKDWPDVGDSALAASLGHWLPPWLAGMTRRSHLARLPLGDALRAHLDRRQQQQLAELAPEHLKLPTGSSARIDYRDDNAPCVAVKLQEMFGAPETPRVGGGAVPVTFKLLSPAQRPLQITRDLASFWRNAYADVRKDMRGRYPKHYWPENPLESAPTRGARRPRSP
jgi:ATP-dependent helicase HrpB